MKKYWNKGWVKIITFRGGSWMFSLFVDAFIIGVPTTIIWALVSGTF